MRLAIFSNETLPHRPAQLALIHGYIALRAYEGLDPREVL